MIMNSNYNIKQQLGKPCYLIFTLCLIIFLFLTGCGTEDYEYKLPNGFRICRINNETITLNAEKSIYEYTNDDGLKGLSSFAVESYIHEFCYNEQYVAVKWFDPEKIDFEDIDSNDFSSPLYYLVDTLATDVFGPYQTQNEFDAACDQMNVGTLGEWISTQSNPDN